MIKNIIILIFLAIFTVVGINLFLQVDDFSKCESKPSSVTGCQKVDAIVAISGGDTAARTKEAIELYKNGWADVLIFSGAALDKTGPSNAYEMRRIAVESDVSEEAIYIDEFAETTKGNAENTQKILQDIEAEKIILVTSGYHQRRASLEFNQYTDDVEVLNHPRKTDKDWSFLWWMTPRGWWLAGSEIVKIVIFMVVGL